MGARLRVEATVLTLVMSAYRRRVGPPCRSSLAAYRDYQDPTLLVLDDDYQEYHIKLPGPIISLAVPPSPERTTLFILLPDRQLYSLGLDYLIGSDLSPRYAGSLSFCERFAHLAE
jgi:hypothetical protein